MAQASRASKNVVYSKMGKWKYVSTKLKGYYGETDYKKKTISIDRKDAKKDFKDDGIPKKDSTLINTIAHEEMHRKHPKMHEDTVRKKTRAQVAKMSKRQRSRLYSKLG